jgi:hypothetical protein
LPEPTLAAVGGCGFVSSVLVAMILWLIEQKFGLALYSWTFWLVVPAGALFAGFGAAGGYCFGAWSLATTPRGCCW